jgi:hypothetical protein
MSAPEPAELPMTQCHHPTRMANPCLLARPTASSGLPERALRSGMRGEALQFRVVWAKSEVLLPESGFPQRVITALRFLAGTALSHLILNADDRLGVQIAPWIDSKTLECALQVEAS